MTPSPLPDAVRLRFERARRTLDFERAMARPPPRRHAFGVIARLLLVAVLTSPMVLIFSYDEGASAFTLERFLIAEAIVVAVLTVLAASFLVPRPRRFLARIESTWTHNLPGGYGGVRVVRSVTLLTEDGTARTCSADGGISVQESDDV